MEEIKMLQSLNSPYVKIDPAFIKVAPKSLIHYLGSVQSDPYKADDLATMFANATCDILTREEFDRVHKWLLDERINKEWDELKLSEENFLFITKTCTPNSLPEVTATLDIMDYVQVS